MVRQWLLLSLFAISAVSLTGCGPKTGTTVVEHPPTTEEETAAYEAEMNQPANYEQ